MTPLVYTMPREEGPHKLMMFQHGCPHHWIAPGRMYFLNISINSKLAEIIPIREFNAKWPIRDISGKLDLLSPIQLFFQIGKIHCQLQYAK